MFCFLSFCTFFKPMDPDSESIPGFSGLLYSEFGSRSLKKAGLGTPFFSVQNVTFFYVLKKECYVLFRSFLEFLATYGTQKNVMFFWKERMPNPEKRYKMTKNNVLRSRSQNFGQKWSKKGPGAKKNNFGSATLKKPEHFFTFYWSMHHFYFYLLGSGGRGGPPPVPLL